MTFFAISGYPESGLVVMTCTTRFTLFHLRHRIADTADPSDKDSAVAFFAFKHFEMVAVAEPGVKCLKTHIHDIFMAFLTIALGRKCSFTVVTSAT